MYSSHPIDTFFHGNIIKYCNRPFINAAYPDLGDATDKRRWDWAAMNEALITYHNELVKPGDDVYDLGDFAFGRDSSEEGIQSVLRRLNGNLHLLWGNHDKLVKEVARKNPGLFAWFDPNMSERNNPIVEFKQGDVDLILCHYPLSAWNHSHKGSMHLYGHVHGQPTPGDDELVRLDAGVDCTDFRPLNIDEWVVRLNKKRALVNKRRVAQ
jgi:calcineurin-like phosphoesterase family protein